MKDVIIFDFFGVICSEVAPYWIAENIPSLDEVEFHERYIRAVDTGKETPEKLFERLGELSSKTPAEVLAGWNTYVSINVELVALIQELRKTKRVALCSNAWSEFIQPILEEHQLSELFEAIEISSEVGYTKPDKEMYLAVTDALVVAPGDCVFIDDNQKNVAAAEALGMEGILFKSVADLQERIR